LAPSGSFTMPSTAARTRQCEQGRASAHR
jgi:hypothetical protein